MAKFKIEWDSGADDGETVIEASTAQEAEILFERKYPDREVLCDPVEV